MINQITNISDKNVFTPLRSSGVNYAITKPITETQKSDEKVIEDDRRGQRLGIGIAAVTLAVGMGWFVATRTFSKNARPKFLNNIISYLNDKVSKLSEIKNKSGIQKFYQSFLIGTRKVLTKSKALFSIASSKDILYHKALEQTSITREINEGIRGFFERVSIKRARNTWDRIFIRFDKNFAEFSEANSKIEGIIPDKEKSSLNEKIQHVKNNVQLLCSREAFNKRLLEVNNDLKTLPDDIWGKTWGNFKNFKNELLSGNFTAEDLATDSKFKLINNVQGLKEKITFSIHDHQQNLKNIYNTIKTKNMSSVKNKETDALMLKLKNNIDIYENVLKKGGSKETLPKENDVIDLLKALNEQISQSKSYTPKTKSELSKVINRYNETLKKQGKDGEIQEIMDIYKKYLLKEDYEKLKKSVTRTLKSLNHSTDLESDKLFDKLRDLKLGAGPHDVVAFITSLGVMGWFLGRAENKDQRISVALKYGIPAVGAVAISTLCTVGLVASGPSLIIGTLAGLVINKIGSGIDNMRKKRKNSEVNIPVDNTPILTEIKEGIELLKQPKKK